MRGFEYPYGLTGPLQKKGKDGKEKRNSSGITKLQQAAAQNGSFGANNAFPKSGYANTVARVSSNFHILNDSYELKYRLFWKLSEWV